MCLLQARVLVTCISPSVFGSKYQRSRPHKVTNWSGITVPRLPNEMPHEQANLNLSSTINLTRSLCEYNNRTQCNKLSSFRSSTVTCQCQEISLLKSHIVSAIAATYLLIVTTNIDVKTFFYVFYFLIKTFFYFLKLFFYFWASKIYVIWLLFLIKTRFNGFYSCDERFVLHLWRPMCCEFMQIKKVKKNAGQVLPKTGFCILLSLIVGVISCFWCGRQN